MNVMRTENTMAAPIPPITAVKPPSAIRIGVWPAVSSRPGEFTRTHQARPEWPGPVDGRREEREVGRVSDGIIDLGAYLRRREGSQEPVSTFALWGADGERSRFALPLWRAIYLATGERGGVVWDAPEGGPLHPFVVLDLGSDPARTDFEWDGAPGLDPGRVPEVLPAPRGGLAVFLGLEEKRRWFLLITSGRGGVAEPTGRDREDILFLAGECAGLLFLRDFADGAT
jgi:hypothetical protein